MQKKNKVLIILACVAAALLLTVLLIVGGYFANNMRVNFNNKKAAATVIEHIDKLDDNAITLDSEHLIFSVKTEYDLLNDKQKKFVTNYDVLENALNTLQNLKDKKIADELINEINKINKSSLTAEDTTVKALLEKYDSLTDAQKALVSNHAFLLECKAVVDEKIVEKEKRDAGIELAENFERFEGKWGDFGAHINKYQGMVEKALHKEATYTRIFANPLNSLDFHVSRFEKSSNIFGIGIAYFSFSGTDKNGYYDYIHGEIIIKEDGSVVATTYYY